jgi:hypothetical protein
MRLTAISRRFLIHSHHRYFNQRGENDPFHHSYFIENVSLD